MAEGDDDDGDDDDDGHDVDGGATNDDRNGVNACYML